MAEPNNRYAPPTANVADPSPPPSDDVLIPYGRVAPPGDGAKWISEAFSLFFKRPWMWLLLVLLLLVILSVASAVPFVNLISTLLWPAIGAGIAYAADVQRRTGNFSISDAFRGFGPSLRQLVVVGVVMILSSVLMFVVMAIVMDTNTALALLGIGTLDFQVMTLQFWLALLIGFAFALPITAATYFAPPLILMHGLSAVDAMKMSLTGAVKNILSGLVYGVLLMLLLLVSAIPIGLGLLITLPVAMITFYTTYRGIFVESK